LKSVEIASKLTDYLFFLIDRFKPHEECSIQYPIAITPSNETTAYGIFVPDIVGCYSASDERTDISNNTKETIMLHLKGLIEDGEAIPLPTDRLDIKIIQILKRCIGQ